MREVLSHFVTNSFQLTMGKTKRIGTKDLGLGVVHNIITPPPKQRQYADKPVGTKSGSLMPHGRRNLLSGNSHFVGKREIEDDTKVVNHPWVRSIMYGGGS